MELQPNPDCQKIPKIVLFYSNVGPGCSPLKKREKNFPNPDFYSDVNRSLICCLIVPSSIIHPFYLAFLPSLICDSYSAGGSRTEFQDLGLNLMSSRYLWLLHPEKFSMDPPDKITV